MTDDRLARLEERVRRLEDERDVAALIAGYGPLADSGDGDGTAAAWTVDGVYDVDTGVYDGRSGIAQMIGSPEHRRLLDRGCAHLLTPPRVAVDGDAAVAVGHSQLVVRNRDGGYDVVRATAHRWELVRTADGWRVARRTSRVLDGSSAARDLLRLPART